jgi:hypothetical protein
MVDPVPDLREQLLGGQHGVHVSSGPPTPGSGLPGCAFFQPPPRLCSLLTV